MLFPFGLVGMFHENRIELVVGSLALLSIGADGSENKTDKLKQIQYTL